MKIKLIDFGAKDNNLVGNRAHYNDAGFDLMCQEAFTIKPQENKVVGCGLGFEIPDGMVGIVFPKSSVNAKGITSRVGIIDSGYRGHVKVILFNDTKEDVHFERGQKIAQLVIMPVVLADFEWELKNDRGTGGFGSTGKK